MDLTFESMVKILWCYHSNETSSAVLSHDPIYLVWSSSIWVCGWNSMVLSFKWNLFSVLSHDTIYLVSSSNFWIYGWNTMVLPFKWNFFGSTFTWCYLFCSILQIEIWIFCPLSTIFGSERVKKKNKYVFLDYRQKIERMGNQWKYKYWRGFESLGLLSFQNKITMKIMQQLKFIHVFIHFSCT